MSARMAARDAVFRAFLCTGKSNKKEMTIGRQRDEVEELP